MKSEVLSDTRFHGVSDALRGEIAYALTKRLVIDMPTARAAVDEAVKSITPMSDTPSPSPNVKVTPQNVVAKTIVRIRALAEKAEAEQKVVVLDPDCVLMLIEALDPAPAPRMRGYTTPQEER